MTQDEILAAVIAAVKQMQEQSRRAIPELDGDTQLVGDVPGCDSLNAVELSFILADSLAEVLDGREIPDSIFLGPNAGARPTLAVIALATWNYIYGSLPERSPTRSKVKA